MHAYKVVFLQIFCHVRFEFTEYLWGCKLEQCSSMTQHKYSLNAAVIFSEFQVESLHTVTNSLEIMIFEENVILKLFELNYVLEFVHLMNV